MYPQPVLFVSCFSQGVLCRVCYFFSGTPSRFFFFFLDLFTRTNCCGDKKSKNGAVPSFEGPPLPFGVSQKSNISCVKELATGNIKREWDKEVVTMVSKT